MTHCLVDVLKLLAICCLLAPLGALHADDLDEFVQSWRTKNQKKAGETNEQYGKRLQDATTRRLREKGILPEAGRPSFDRAFFMSSYVLTAALDFDDKVDDGNGNEFRRLDRTFPQSKVVLGMTLRHFAIYNIIEDSLHNGGEGFSADNFFDYAALELNKGLFLSFLGVQGDLSIFLDVPPTTITAPAGLSEQNGSALEFFFNFATLDVLITGRDDSGARNLYAGISFSPTLYFQAAADPNFQQVNVVWGFGSRLQLIVANPFNDKPAEFVFSTYSVNYVTPDVKKFDPDGNGPLNRDSYALLDTNRNIERNDETGVLIKGEIHFPITSTLSFIAKGAYIVQGRTNPWSLTTGVTLSFASIGKLLGIDSDGS